MRFQFLLLLLLPAFLAGAQTPADSQAISAVLMQQQAAWNAGNVAQYMAAGYWQSDSLVFIGKAGPTYGYDSTLARYRRSYPTPAAMGQLTFSGLSIKLLAPAAAFVIGRWHLKRAAGDLSGSFTLLFEQKRGRWVIVADHSS